jgi:undecaprenyl diphosphate synthase
MTDNSQALPELVPYHLAVIMDGKNLRRVLRSCSEFGIKILTIYAFSTENWGRPPSEVRGLMGILEMVIDRELDDLDANGVQLRHLGRLDGLAPELQRKVCDAIERTRNNDRLTLNVAFNYGGRDEILRAIRRIVQDGIPAQEIDEVLFNYYLDTAGQPDVDLVVRTAGEMRVSNFLIWQANYAEYYATPTYWPDFDKEELRKALLHYNKRDRKFGLVK